MEGFMQTDVAAPSGERVQKKQLAVRVSESFRDWLDSERGSIPREHYMRALAMQVGESQGGVLPDLHKILADMAPRSGGAAGAKVVIIHPTLAPDQMQRVRGWADSAGLSPGLWVRCAVVQGRLLGAKVLP